MSRDEFDRMVDGLSAEEMRQVLELLRDMVQESEDKRPA